uniref:Syntaxin-binding protein 2 n=1 Tax=Rhipicephalus pulchellus TaxID=72859 RepID=L7LZZ3_RHIPC
MFFCLFFVFLHCCCHCWAIVLCNVHALSTIWKRCFVGCTFIFHFNYYCCYYCCYHVFWCITPASCFSRSSWRSALECTSILGHLF